MIGNLFGNKQARQLASVQNMLPLESIENDAAVLRGGERVAVLTTSRINFAMASIEQRESILAGYRRLLNSIDHPFQLLIQVTPADIEGYIEQLQSSPWRDSDSMGGLDALIEDHAEYVRGLARERGLLERNFYIVIPSRNMDHRPAVATSPISMLSGFFRKKPTSDDEAHDPVEARRTLQYRCAHFGEALASFGVYAHRLDNTEIADLWRAGIAGWRPRGSRLRINPDDASPVVIAPGSALEVALYE